MRYLMMLAVLLSCAGCTTLRPVTDTPENLRARLSAGELLKAGDSVSIVTTDGKRHNFEVTGVSDGAIHGRSDSVPVNQVVRLEKRAPDHLSTAMLVLVALGVGSLAAIAHTGVGLSGH